ncbi:MAG: HD-GYP domain-containing protein [Desulfocucumaceae bacterium]
MGLIENLLDIGIALSTEKDHNRLLEMILTEARRITNADAGTLYLCEKDRLVFKILHNKTMNTFRGGRGETIDIPPVKLVKENVSAHVALTGKSVNIEDVYNAEGFDFSGPRNYDKITGYRTRSMLVVPMENHESQIIGVLQLINAMDDGDSMVIPFASHYQKVIESLASQAAIALTNARLISDIEQLFHSFVQMITTAIDARTPYNANHSRRVALLAGELAVAINQSGREIWQDKKFSDERLQQLVMAGWLHDIGKVATPLEVMNKATRLEDRLDFIMQRFEYIYQARMNQIYRELFRPAENRERCGVDEIEAGFDKQLEGIFEARELVLKANDPATFIDDQIAGKLAAIASLTYRDLNGRELPYLTREEFECLTIRKGTLTEDERKIMEDHVAITARMLEKIPFIRKYASVPEYSAMHHEHLDGKGYPNRLAGDQIPLEARILALVDVYDALTAGDRPYKKALPVEDALRILGFMVKDGKLDADLFELFRDSRVWENVKE